MWKPELIISSPDILGGTPVFADTCVPIKITDYLEAGDTLTEFLADFPSVSSEQAVAVLEHLKGGDIHSMPCNLCRSYELKML